MKSMLNVTRSIGKIKFKLRYFRGPGFVRFADEIDEDLLMRTEWRPRTHTTYQHFQPFHSSAHQKSNGTEFGSPIHFLPIAQKESVMTFKATSGPTANFTAD